MYIKGGIRIIVINMRLIDSFVLRMIMGEVHGSQRYDCHDDYMFGSLYPPLFMWGLSQMFLYF